MINEEYLRKNNVPDYESGLKRIIDYINSLIDKGVEFYANNEVVELATSLLIDAKKWAIENENYAVERLANQLEILIEKGKIEKVLPEGAPLPSYAFGDFVEIIGEGKASGMRGIIDERFFTGEPHNIWIYHIVSIDGSGGGGAMTREDKLRLIKRDIPGPHSAELN